MPCNGAEHEPDPEGRLVAEIAEHKYEIARHRRLLRKAAAALATIRGTGADPDLDHFLS